MKHSDLKNLTIAIVGAGYAGAATAKALSLLGADVTVYEQATQIREVGAGIGLRPSTMGRFREWGIFDAIAKVSSPSDYFEILTATGDPIMKEAWPEIDTYGAKTHLIHRGDFIDALVGVLPEGMVQCGHKLATIEDKGDRSVLTFANGTIVEADLVVGADGIKSVVRQQLFSDAGPVFSGERAYRAVIDVADTHGLAVDDNLRMYLGHGTKVYVLPLRHRNQVSFDVTSLCPDVLGQAQTQRILDALGLDPHTFDGGEDHLLILRHTLMNPYLIDRENGISYIDRYFDHLAARVRVLAKALS